MKFAAFSFSLLWGVGFLLVALAACNDHGGGSSRDPAITKDKKAKAGAHQETKAQTSGSEAGEGEATADEEIAADACLLDDKVTKVKITVTGKKLESNDLSAKYLAMSSVKGAIDKLFPNPKDAEAKPANRIEEEAEGKKLAFYHIPLTTSEPSEEESGASEGADGGEKTKSAKLHPEKLGKVTAFKFTFKSDAKTFVIEHNEGEEVQAPGQQEPTYKYLFGYKVKKEEKVTADFTLQALKSLEIEKDIFDHEVIDICERNPNACKCPATKTCKEKNRDLRIYETNRFELEELEIKVNNQVIFSDKVHYVFATAINPQLDQFDPAITYASGRTVKLDLANNAKFKNLLEANRSKCQAAKP